MITAKSLTNGTLIVIFDNCEQQIAREDHPRWKELVEAYATDNETALRNLFSMKKVVEHYTQGSITVDGTGVLYNGVPLEGVDVDRLLGFLNERLPYTPMVNFLQRKMANTSQRAITELYPFLEHGNMPITARGTFIGYKGVREDFYSVRGNKSTIVIQGVKDSNGHILNEIGCTIEVARNCVSDDFRNACGPGLHVGDLSYAVGWGRKVILVEVDPADVVSIPEDCSCRKLRCCKYKVIGEYTGPLPDTYTPEFDGEDAICPQCGEIEDDCICEDGECPECLNPTDECTCGQEDDSETPDSMDCPTCGKDIIFCDCDNPVPAPEKTERPVGDVEQVANETGIFSAANQALLDKTQAALQGELGDTPEEHEEDYLEGMKLGIQDRIEGQQPRYLPGDQEGADSPRHAARIDGYVDGYAE